MRLEQAVSNLLSNAFRHSAPGTRVEVTVRNCGNDGQISVRDYGDGIDPDLLPKIFDPFVQGSQSLARSLGGLGLGLTVVRSLVERHGGGVAAHSRGRGFGSEFSIKLPLSAGRADSHRSHDQIHVPSQSRRIVVVEDNPDVRLTLVRLLERQGHQVIEAQDGTSGLDKIVSWCPHLAFIDIGLPGMDGYAIARQVRAKMGTTVQLVAVTGYGQSEDRQRALACGFDCHLVKPVDFRALYELVEHCDEARD